MEVLAKKEIDNPHTCYICSKALAGQDKKKTLICKSCRKIINIYITDEDEKERAMALMGPEVAKIRKLIKQGINSKKLQPVCRICKTKYNSHNYMSDPTNLICRSCYRYIEEILPEDRRDLNQVKLTKSELFKLRKAWEKDKYEDENRKKHQWFLEEYCGKLPDIEHLTKLVGVQQAQRIYILEKQRRRELHAQRQQDTKK